MNKEAIRFWSGIGVSILAFVIYALTSSQFVMYWDSGEFIASSYKLHATHPPGAPLYTLLSRLFLMLFPVSKIAYGAALFSALCAAVTVWFAYQVSVWLAENGLKKLQETEKYFHLITIAGVLSALTLTFSDTFWVASTEAEVYTLSTLFMGAAFWAAIQWEKSFGKNGNNKWLLLIIFILGLSIGVHILNLAVLFPIALVVSIKKWGLNLKSVLIGFGSALFLFFGLYNVLVQKLLGFIVKAEIYFVNEMSFSQHTGAILAYTMWFVLLLLLIVLFRIRKNPFYETIVLGVMLFTIGWSSYIMPMIRTSEDTPTSNDARDVLRLLDYIRSDQYGFSDRPLIFGKTFNSPLNGDDQFVNGDPVLIYDSEKSIYKVTNTGEDLVPNYHSAGKVLFPRMFDTDPINVNGYNEWVDYKGKEIPLKVVVNGETKNAVIPSLGENIRFFWNYQFVWLNFRYLMWNFVGKQNEISGTGDGRYGNWISGLGFLDRARVGYQNDWPDYFKKLASKNSFYFIPFVLGLLGLYFLYQHNRNGFLVSFIFFLAFGLAITIFINQKPIHALIRDRDYIFLGAFFMFSIWVGLGVIAVYNWIPKNIKASSKLLIASLLTLLAPLLMALDGWDDHDRTQHSNPRDVAKHILDQCDEDAILIGMGDNIVFPMWYLQEVEGYRTDVRVIEQNLLNLPWYVNRLRLAINKSSPVLLQMPRNFYEKGRTRVFPLQPITKDAKELSSVLNFIAKQKEEKFMPVDHFTLKVDESLDLLNYKVKEDSLLIDLNWIYTKQQYNLDQIVIMDIIANNAFKRPIYFTNTGTKLGIGLDDYLVNKGLVRELNPIKNKGVDVESLRKLVYDFDLNLNGEFIRGVDLDMARNVYRPAFISLADYYLKEERISDTYYVLQELENKMPDSSIPYGEELLDAAFIYLELGSFEEWRVLARKIMNNKIAELNWLVSFDPDNPIISYNRATLLGEEIAGILTQLGRRDNLLIQEYDSKLDNLKTKYNDWIRQNSKMSKRASGGN